MIDIRDIGNIEAYINQKLPDKEVKEFEALIKSDAEFADTVENIRTGIYATNIIGREELKRKLKVIHKNMKHKKSGLSIFLKVAAIFIGISIISFFTWYSISANQNYNNLYANNFEPYTNLLTVKGKTQNIDEQALMNNAMYNYDLHNYSKANEFFERLLIYKQDNDTILFYYGISKLGANEVEDAIILFNQLVKKEKSLFFRFGHAKWYLALAYLNNAGKLQEGNHPKDEINNTLNKSKLLLQDIINNNGDFAVDAQRLLKKID